MSRYDKILTELTSTFLNNRLRLLNYHLQAAPWDAIPANLYDLGVINMIFEADYANMIIIGNIMIFGIITRFNLFVKNFTERCESLLILNVYNNKKWKLIGNILFGYVY